MDEIICGVGLNHEGFAQVVFNEPVDSLELGYDECEAFAKLLMTYAKKMRDGAMKECGVKHLRLVK